MKMTNKERFYEAADRRGYWSWVEAVRDADGTILGVTVHSKEIALIKTVFHRHSPVQAVSGGGWLETPYLLAADLYSGGLHRIHCNGLVTFVYKGYGAHGESCKTGRAFRGCDNADARHHLFARKQAVGWLFDAAGNNKQGCRDGEYPIHIIILFPVRNASGTPRAPLPER